MAQNIADADWIARFGPIWQDAENATVDRFDFLDCLIPFDAEEPIA